MKSDGSTHSVERGYVAAGFSLRSLKAATTRATKWIRDETVEGTKKVAASFAAHV